MKIHLLKKVLRLGKKSKLILVIVILLLIASLFGCRGLFPTKTYPDDPFLRLYQIEGGQGGNIEQVSLPDSHVNLSVQDMHLKEFLMLLSDDYNITVVAQENLINKSVTLEIKDASISTTLNLLSRQMGVDLITFNGVYYLGNLRAEDRGIYVKKIYGSNLHDIKETIQSLLSTQGKCYMANRILVVADHEAVIRRVDEAITYYHNVKNPVWILQLHFVSLRADALLEGGISTKSSGKLSYDMASNKIKLDDLQLEALFDFNTGSNYADVYASPMFLLNDGQNFRFQDGEKIPIPKKSVSNEGTVTTVDYTYIETGLILNGSISELSSNTANLSLNITLSDAKNYVDEAPITVQTELSLNIDMLPGKIMLLSEVPVFRDLQSRERNFSFSKSYGKTNVQLWGKVYKINPSTSILPDNSTVPDVGEITGSEVKNLPEPSKKALPRVMPKVPFKIRPSTK